MSVTSEQAQAKFGSPYLEKSMVLVQVPKELQKGMIPKKVYCNKVIEKPLLQAFKNLIDRNLVTELKTWDGCFSIRPIRGYAKEVFSLHSWGIAVDVNAVENALGATPKLSPDFVRCFTDAGFEWGGGWTRRDGMHFQIATL
jgi:hypothetical protein